MARQNIYVGAAGNDGTGDDLRTAGIKINDNFTELYSVTSTLSLNLSAQQTTSEGISFANYGIRFDGPNLDSGTTYVELVPSVGTGQNVITMPDSTGTMALVGYVDAEIAKLDSAFVLSRHGTGTTLLDSARAISLIRAYAEDSSEILNSIDSAYVMFRQSYDFNQLINVPPLLDSGKVLNFTYTQTRADSDFLDFLNSHIGNPTRTLEGVDSAVIYLSGQILGSTTDDVPEGPTSGRVYYTKARFDSDIATTFDSIGQDLLPGLDSTYDLGSPTRKWKDLHLSGNTIYLGNTTITNDGSNINFGIPITAEIVVVNSVDVGSNVIQSSTDHLRLRPAGGHDVRLQTIDGANIFTATTNNYIYVGDSAGANNYGWLHVGNNTTTQRNTSSTTQGAIHYNETDNTFEFKDNSGWFALDKNTVSATLATVATTGAYSDLSGTPTLATVATTGDYNDLSNTPGAISNSFYLEWGRDASISSATDVALFGANGSSLGEGRVLPVTCIATHITHTFNVTVHNSPGNNRTVWLELYKNGADTGIDASIEVTNTGYYYVNIDISDTIFLTGHRVDLRLSQDADVTTDNHHAIIRFIE